MQLVFAGDGWDSGTVPASGSYDPPARGAGLALVVLARRMFHDPFYGARSQVTLVELGGVRGYVREHRHASGISHFCMDSGARLGHRARGDVIGREVLLVAAPRGTGETIAAAVAGRDELRRPVMQSPRWNLATAGRAWARARPISDQADILRGRNDR